MIFGSLMMHVHFGRLLVILEQRLHGPAALHPGTGYILSTKKQW